MLQSESMQDSGFKVLLSRLGDVAPELRISALEDLLVAKLSQDQKTIIADQIIFTNRLGSICDPNPLVQDRLLLNCCAFLDQSLHDLHLRVLLEDLQSWLTGHDFDLSMTATAVLDSLQIKDHGFERLLLSALTEFNSNILTAILIDLPKNPLVIMKHLDLIFDYIENNELGFMLIDVLPDLVVRLPAIRFEIEDFVNKSSEIGSNSKLVSRALKEAQSRLQCRENNTLLSDVSMPQQYLMSALISEITPEQFLSCFEQSGFAALVQNPEYQNFSPEAKVRAVAFLLKKTNQPHERVIGISLIEVFLNLYQEETVFKILDELKDLGQIGIPLLRSLNELAESESLILASRAKRIFKIIQDSYCPEN